MAESTWHHREVQILEAVAEAMESDEMIDSNGISERTGIPTAEVIRGVGALLDAEYINATPAGGPFLNVRLRERGLREIGAWPSPNDDLVEPLLALLNETIASADDADDKNALENMRDAVAGVGTPVLSGLLLTYVKMRLGLPT